MEHYIESYLERWLNSTPNPSNTILTFFSRIQATKWSQISLVRVLYSFRAFAVSNQNRALLNDEHIKVLSTLILTQFHTFAPVLRLSAYKSLLDSVVELFDWSTCSTSSHLLKFLAFFDRPVFLSKHFSNISSHLTFDIRQLQNLIAEFLSSDSTTTVSNTRLFSTDNDLLQIRKIAFLLDLLEIPNTDVLKTVFHPMIENIRTAYQRPYMSINNVRRSIELFSGLIQETYFHSSNFVKDGFSSSMRSITREGLSFIKTNCVRKID